MPRSKPLPLCGVRRRPRLRWAALILVLLAPAAAAEEAVVPQSQAQLELSFAPVVRKAAPAVVNIYTRRVVQTQVSPLFSDPFFQRFFGEGFGFGRPRERIQNSLGSGVIISSDGLVVTNEHVIKDSDEITVVLGDRRELPAELVTQDPRTDLALLRIDAGGRPLPYLELHDSDALEVGDLVLAIGNPFGVGQTVTGGIVSALARTHTGISDFGFFIQTDAAINPGNSGGALVAMDGRLVGINTAIYSRTGGSVGIGFAIPSNMVATIIAAERTGGRVVRPWIGLSGQAVTADLAEGLRLDRPLGVLVKQVFPDGPAARAGLEIGDVVLAVNDREVADPEALRFRLATLPVGETAALTVVRRDGAEERVAVDLMAAPEVPPPDRTALSGEHPLAGATVANLSPALAEELSIGEAWSGVVVVAVKRGSIAGRLRLAPGDVLLRLNDEEIASVEMLREALRSDAARWKITFRRDGETRTIVVG